MMRPLRLDRHVTAAAALCVALHTGAAFAQTTSSRAVSAADVSTALQSVAATVVPTVVEIFTTSYAPGEGLVVQSADLVVKQRASGSGVIVDPDGYIVTNAHVVRGANRLRVEISAPDQGRSILAGRTHTADAQIVGIDLETDLAVLKVEAGRLPAISFGNSDDLKAGQLVMALGSPLGLRNSVSLGVVSAVARQMEPESPMIYIQTDAAINAGSSGGALVDLTGRLVGINTMIVSQTGGNEGLSFAAPGNIVQAVYQQIRKTGRVRRGDLGIRAQTITPELASGLGLPRNRGVVLADVIPRSSAAVAGLRAGDIVLSLDGKAMENGRQLRVDLYRRAVGEIVSLQILRGETVSVFPVAVEERRDVTGLSAAVDPRQNLVQRLGILGLTLTPQLADVVPVVRVRSGVVVASTIANGLDAKDGGLAPGDIIYAVNRTSVSALDDLRSALGAFKPGDAVVLQIERRGELMFLTFTID